MPTRTNDSPGASARARSTRSSIDGGGVLPFWVVSDFGGFAAVTGSTEPTAARYCCGHVKYDPVIASTAIGSSSQKPVALCRSRLRRFQFARRSTFMARAHRPRPGHQMMMPVTHNRNTKPPPMPFSHRPMPASDSRFACVGAIVGHAHDPRRTRGAEQRLLDAEFQRV